MRNLRLWQMALVMWLLLFYNVERLHAPINIASFVYPFAAVLCLIVLATPSSARLPLVWLLLLPVPCFLSGKWLLGYPIAGSGLPLTITEICAISVTSGLAWSLTGCLRQFEAGVASIMIQKLYEPLSFEAGQVDIYREVRRARLHERPLALFVVSATEESTRLSDNRFVEEVQRATIRNYIDARIRDLLCKATKDCGVITQRDDHFVVVLPETSPAEAAELACEVKSMVQSELNLDLRIGWSTFPDEEVTFDQLLEHATHAMRSAIRANHRPHEPIASRNGEHLAHVAPSTAGS